MHADVCEPIWFKLGLMIDATELNNLILVYEILTLIQGHRDARNKTFLHHLSYKVWNGFGQFGMLLRLVGPTYPILILSVTCSTNRHHNDLFPGQQVMVTHLSPWHRERSDQGLLLPEADIVLSCCAPR